MFESAIHLIQRIEFQWIWLWCLLPLPLLLRFLPKSSDVHQYSVRVPNLPRLLDGSQLAGSARTKQHHGHALLYAMVWFCLVFASARPQWITPPQYQDISARDVVLVLDVSGSMATEDMQDLQGRLISRAKAMQNAVRAFIHERAQDNIGMVVFGSKAYPFAPLSADHHVLLQRVNDLRPAMAGPQTSIGDAIGSTIKMYNSLKPDGEPLTENEKMVVLLTDGKDTASTLPPDVALRLAKQERVIIHTIALAGGNQESINLALLQKIARQTDGTFHEVDGRLRSLQDVYHAINQLTPRKMKKRGWAYRQPLFLWPLGVGMAGLAVLGLCLSGGRTKNE